MNLETFPVSCTNVTCVRGGRQVLDNVSLQIRKGCRMGLIGPNGAGKTTLFRVILGLDKISSGNVSLEGMSISKLSRKAVARLVAYVPQDHHPVFPYRVLDITAMGRISHTSLGRTIPTRDIAFAHAALNKMGISHLAERPYTELSGGERRSVLIARTLAQGSRIIVLDEPTNGLDYGQQLRLRSILRDLASEGYTIIASSHHPLQLSDDFDDAVLIKRGSVAWSGSSKAVSIDMINSLYDVSSDSSGF